MAALVLGRVGTEGSPDTANPSGTIAFALAINEDTGVAYSQQWLSLTNPTAGDGTNGGTRPVAPTQVVVPRLSCPGGCEFRVSALHISGWTFSSVASAMAATFLSGPCCNR